MASQPDPRTWIVNDDLLAAELNTSVRDWNRASALGIATQVGQMFCADGVRDLRTINLPTQPMVLVHDGVSQSCPYWAKINGNRMADDTVENRHLQDDCVTADEIENLAIRRQHLGVRTADGVGGASAFRKATIPASSTQTTTTRYINANYPTFGWWVITYRNMSEVIFSNWTIPCALGFNRVFEFDEAASAHGRIRVVRRAVHDPTQDGNLATEDRLVILEITGTQAVDYEVYWYHGVPGVGVPN